MLSKKNTNALVSLNSLYTYVFTNEAIHADLSSIITDLSLSKKFHTMLEQQNPERAKQLYGYNIKQVPLDTFPTEEYIGKKFEQLNNKYQYFSSIEEAKKKFVTLFKGTKLIADFIEQNNSEDNEVAYLHAYKIFVLFGYEDNKQQNNPFSHCQNFLNHFIYTQKSNFPKPIHDILVHELPINTEQIINPKGLKQWRKIIANTGFAAVKLFSLAPAIQKLLGRAPENYAEAELQKIAMSYKNYKEHPQLAQLCLDYNINEEIFNTCLTIKPKTTDELPNIIIDGKSCHQKGYYLVKLPIHDPRGYILGKITNCCQSIGGHSEQCVIDGITLEKNGFYVLLKAKKTDTNKPLLNKDGKQDIDYEHYDIVGQGYAWVSNLDNFTFDSWENLRPEIDDSVIVPMLVEFAKELTKPLPKERAVEPLPILRVTIGTGGKTPKGFAHQQKVDNPEKIAQGCQYVDSKEQVLIAQNDENIKELEENLKKIVSTQRNNFIYSNKQAAWLTLLAHHKSQYIEEFSQDYDQLLSKAIDNISLLEIAILLHTQKLLTLQHYQLLVGNAQYTLGIAAALSELHKANHKLVNDENFKLITKEAKNAWRIPYALALLHKVDPKLISDENFKLIPENPLAIAEILAVLHQTDPNLISHENRKLLAQKLKYASNISMALNQLQKGYPKLISDKTFKLIAENADNAWRITQVLALLYKVDPELINDLNYKLLAKTAHNSRGFSGFYDVKFVLLDEFLESNENEYFSDSDDELRFDLNAKKVEYIAKALAQLYKAAPKLISNENFKLLANYARNAQDIAAILIRLYKTDPNLINNANRELIAENAHDSSVISGLLYRLHKANPKLINAEHFKLIVQHKNKGDIYKALGKLYRADSQLVTENTLKVLMNHDHPLEAVAQIRKGGFFSLTKTRMFHNISDTDQICLIAENDGVKECLHPYIHEA